MVKIEKNKQKPRKTSAIELSKFQEKYNYFLHYLGYFWQETGWSHKPECQNQNLTYPILHHMIPGQLLKK